jgi:thiol-disulfide isomerase/thioredoxin
MVRRAVLLGALGVAALIHFPGRVAAQLPVIRFVRDPDIAPDFKLKDLDAKDISLADSRGKVVLLNFWATWCGPCRAEIPSLIALQKRYKDKLQIVGLVVDEDDDTTVRQIVGAEGINYPIALSTPEIRMTYGGILALPTVFVINPEGRVVQKHVGLFDPGLYETEVRALLDLPIAAKVETFDDTGGIFLKHADRATMLPGVDMSKLSMEQRASALHAFNAEDCTCGCKFTLAQCRIYDPACALSQKRTAEIVAQVSSPAAVKDKTITIPYAPDSPETPKP